ncbi:MAG: hypothetical protein IH596_02090 [Bacteroidales bacterium]|nr:hypothetical protein [Bacteroidales bacterium]
MKTGILIFVMTLASVLSSAQSDTTTAVHKKSRNVLLDVHAGYSMAFGKYSMTDRENKQEGYAADGFFVQVSGSWLGRSGLGLGIGYCYQNNWLQSGVADDTLVGHYKELGSKHWSNHYFLAGPVFIRSYGKWLVTLKAQAGAVLAFSPVFRIWMPSTDTLNPNNTSLSDGPGAGIAFQGLAGIGYKVTDNLTINLAFSYLGGNPNRTKSYSQYVYETDPDTGDKNLVFLQGEIQRKKKISTFHVGLGIVFKL